MAALAALALALPLGALPGAATPPETPAGDGCRDVTGGATERLCMSLDAGANAVTAVCREAAGLPPDECSTPSGRVVRSDLVDAYVGTWVHRAHVLQRRLGDALTLRHGLMAGTHNSYNSAAYFPTVSGLDPNQQYTITDQLAMDIRALELDVHWFPHPSTGSFAPVLCHATGPHAGCSWDRHLAEGLAEIAGWLAANPDEVLVVRFEDHLDGEEGYLTAAALIEEYLGAYAYTPPAGECTGLPLDVSRADVRSAGKQVILTSDCGIGSAWPSLMFRYDRREARPQGFAGYPDCDGRSGYDTTFVRYFEDGTWLTAMTGSPDDGMTPETTREMVRCGVNQVDFDHLTPDDGRLAAALWSWAPDEPAATEGPACAEHGADGRFRAVPCATRLAFVCSIGGGWTVTTAAGPWFAGERTCRQELGPGARFDVPRAGWLNELVVDAKAAVGAERAWLRYADVTGRAEWTAG